MLKTNTATRALLRDNKLRARWGAVEYAARRWESYKGGEAIELMFRAARKALPLLLTESSKTIKSLKLNALTGICHLSPATESGYDVCPWRSPGCTDACLGHSSGRMGIVAGGGLGNAKRARILRTWAFLGHRALFMVILRHEIQLLFCRAWDRGLRPFVRVNGTSDLPIEKWGLLESFPSVQFYDYTKNPQRMKAFTDGKLPRNYHLTFSRSEENESACDTVLRDGGNVAAVFLGTFPEDWRGTDVVNGDETDARPDDTGGVYVGLTAKGPKAKRDTTGFVIT